MYDTIIIGCGPAGICAAIYTARATLKTLVIGILENSNAHKAHIFENYMGFEQQISGPYLMETSKKQAEKFGAVFLKREVVDITPLGDGTFRARDTEGEEHLTKTVIICSGLGFKPSGIKNEKNLIGKGLSYCVTCDGPFFKGKKVVVVGNGNYAADEAIQLTAYTLDITILSHGKKFEMSEKWRKALQDRHIQLQETPRIRSIEASPQTSNVEKLIFVDESEMLLEGVFIAIGIATAADFANKLGLERNGEYLVADPKTGKTNVPSIFAAGDCTGGNAQANKSAGEGCNAAISVIKFLKGVAAYVDYS